MGFFKNLRYILLLVAIPLVGFSNFFPKDLSSLQTRSSELKITPDELRKWDETVQELLKKSPLQDGDSHRLYAYLYQAQRAFALASYDLTGSFSGSLGPISVYILQLFYPHYQNKEGTEDPLSQELTTLLSPSIRSRFVEEQSHIHSIKIHLFKDSWKGKSPYFGLRIPTMQPWSLTKASEFKNRTPPPPQDPFWQKQLAEVKRSMEQVTPEQKKQILFWAGMSPPGSGDFKDIVEKYMAEKNVPLEKRFEVRALVASTIVDAFLSIFFNKYLYLVRRPDMLDPNLKTYIPTPNFPSYPAGHSGVSAAVKVVLNDYFPENQQEWERMAEECGMSRIWAGIHFPIDHKEGKALGLKVGQASLKGRL